ncbi:hypothetical protein [Acidocella sp.]|uniref:hypothetical protein n=1 Tax=Acidocella sp. TaxID=50710 RepID=UPI003D08C364
MIINDKGNIFTNCRFYRCEWQVGSIGTDWNNSKRGEYQSRYVSCCFENVKLTKTGFGDPRFVNCTFVFKKLSGLDFGCSGFVNCRFEGAFQDLTFRGQYSNKEYTARKGEPQYAGFTNVSFEKTALQWFALLDGFPLRSVKRPEDGSAFLADMPWLCREQKVIMSKFSDQRSKEVLSRYLNIDCGAAERQPVSILSRYDLFESFAKGEEALILPVYALLKQEYEIFV